MEVVNLFLIYDKYIVIEKNIFQGPHFLQLPTKSEQLDVIS